VIVAAVEVLTELVVTVNVVLVVPAGTVTLAPTVADDELLERSTTAPPGGAAPLSVIVPVDEAPALTVPGLKLTEASVSDPEPDPGPDPLPGPLELPAQEYTLSTISASPAVQAKPRSRFARLPVLKSMHKTASKAPHTVIVSPRRRMSGAAGGKAIGVSKAFAVVFKLTVTLAECVPSSVSDCGEIAQVAAAGAPLQLQLIVWLKPFTGVAVRV
jgi:hypothetical protein